MSERNRFTRQFAILTCVIAMCLGAAHAASVQIEVKETASVAVDSHPVQVVIPLPEGELQSTGGFRIHDGSKDIPAQFEVLTRYWGRGDSIRHVLAQFQTSLGSGAKKSVTFHTTGSNPAPSDAVTVQDNSPSGFLTVTTGPIRFTVAKQNFTILDTVWFDKNGDRQYTDAERIIVPSPNHGARYDGCTNVSSGSCTAQSQNDRDMAAPTIEIEERGPMRVVLKAWLPTSLVDKNDDQDADDSGEHFRHGYAVRIYAYAGKPWIKIDYQLQNSAKGPDATSNEWGVWSNPLYFNSLNLDWNLELAGTINVRTGRKGSNVDSRTLDGRGVELAHTLHDRFKIRPADGQSPFENCADNCNSSGFMDVSDGSVGVTTVIRNMWETWPNGIEIDGSGKLSVQLFPDWSRQYVRTCSNDTAKICFFDHQCNDGGKCNRMGFTDADVYWLDDMRYVFKEVMLQFHDGSESNADLVAFAKAVHNYPVPVVDLDWYNVTRNTLDLFGTNPNSSRVGSDQLRVVYSDNDKDETDPNRYHFGWDTWYITNVPRKIAPGMAGNQPHSSEYFIATESPADYWKAEYNAIAELNVRPHWMTDYSYSRDWGTMELTQAPYGDGHWRAQDFDREFKEHGWYSIPGTGKSSKAMDDQHAWLYHVEEYYYYSGNPWIRDYYEFLGEFRKSTLAGVERYEDDSQRGRGHMAANAMQAYRITGDTTIPKMVYEWVRDVRRPDLNLKCGQWEATEDVGTTAYYAYLFRPLIAAMQYHDGRDNQAWAELFSYLSSGMEWNYHYGKYGYNVNYDNGYTDCTVNPSGSSGNSGPVVDPASWYYWNTGIQRFKTMNDSYVNGGVNGGKPPYEDWSRPWKGGYFARSLFWENDQVRADKTPPGRITDVTAAHAGSTMTVQWTAPQDAARYLVVWADRPISEQANPDTSRYRNWWAAHPVGPDFAPRPGSRESLTINVGSTANPHVAVFTFDSNNNFSSMSNVASAESGPVETPDPPTDLTTN